MSVLCECGCGQPAPIAKNNDRVKGHVKGQPVRFVSGHNSRGKPKSPETIARMQAAWKGKPKPWLRGPRPSAFKSETPAPGDAHAFLNRHYRKDGCCEHCGRHGKTDYAFKRHPEPHTRNRDDYLELCRRCHTKFDVEGGTRPLWTGVANANRQAAA